MPVTSDEGDPWKLSSRRKPNSYPATPVQCSRAGGVFTEERPRPTAAEIAAVSWSFLLRTQAASTSNAKRENEGEARTDLCPQGQQQSKPQPASISTRDAARRGDGAGRGEGVTHRCLLRAGAGSARVEAAETFLGPVSKRNRDDSPDAGAALEHLVTKGKTPKL